VIQQACLQGYRWFDFGRTDADGEGLRAFKRSWGALEEPLVHHGFGGRGRDVTSTDGRASRLVGAVIRRAPASVCRASGELFYRFTA
jgi:CelD/BcsL family acetyltransferase involved in cellulose biosynthesis